MTKKNEVEALLFSSGRAIEIEDIARICRSDTDEIKKSLDELKKYYDTNKKPLLLVQDGTAWRLTVREAYSHIVEKVVAEAELTKTLMETLAVIAWKAPMLQSELIKVRTNKAYEHVAELLESGFLSKKRHGRSYMLNLSPKFFDYFDLKGKEDLLKKMKQSTPKPGGGTQETTSIDETKAAVAKLFEAMITKAPDKDNENPSS